MTEALHTCPCCGFPTLEARAVFDICEICWWEDDGQDAPYADEVWAGPNKDYSLTMARQNFLAHRHMYDAGEGIDVVEFPDANRLALLAYVNKVLDREVGLDPKRLGQLLSMPQSPHRPMPRSSP
ncbi:CPCC family cysteine-rich protein [Aliiroseovarius sp.]|uniref:CPCC family cysteine-rich protein n=1 Tax=Aliiroseovarius sp. TaxID=1872442 RepID=UPI003BA844D5